MKKLFTCFILSWLFADLKAQYNTVGSAVHIAGNEYQLTQPTAFNQKGGVWRNRRIDLTHDFVMITEIFPGARNATGADGLAFVLQSSSPFQLGQSGGFMGYGGLRPSLAVEFDTWRNPDFRDPEADHLAFMRNGEVVHGTLMNPETPSSFANIETGTWQPVIIHWQAAIHRLRIFFNGTISSLNEDIVNTIFGGATDVFWGFTGGTGANVNDQRVRIYLVTAFTTTINIIGGANNAFCPGGNGGMDVRVTGGTPPYTYEWSNGSTESFAFGPRGLYTVIVRDAAGHSSSAAFYIGEDPDRDPPTVVCAFREFFCAPKGATFDIRAGYMENPPCGAPVTITYVVTGATSRSGTGLDASGPLNFGRSFVTWTVTDPYGNVGTCTAEYNIQPPTDPSCGGQAPRTKSATNELVLGQASTSIYPNPTGGKFELRIRSAKIEKAEVMVINANGVNIHRKTVQLNDNNSVQLDLSKQPAGVYLVKVLINGRTETMKVVVQR